MARHRCLICGEVVQTHERHEHLLAHAPAYGATGSPRITATMFEDVDGDAAAEHEPDDAGPQS